MKTVDTSFILSLLNQAKSEYEKNNSENSHLTYMILRLKILLTQLPSLQSCSEEVDQTELLLARDVLELATFISIKQKDIATFERNVMELFIFYNDYKEIISPSKNESVIRGIYLVHLLSCDRIGEFHIALEHILHKDRESQCISYSIELEHYLTDGNYNKIMEIRNKVPLSEYSFFIDKLVDTCRGKVAKCIEQSYEKISLDKLQNMMKFTDTDDLIRFINNMSSVDFENIKISDTDTLEKRIKWDLIGDTVVFTSVDQPANNTTLDLIQNSLGYAIELERII
ncbi:SAC3/GANP family protein [Cryptosporidium serpentis]